MGRNEEAYTEDPYLYNRLGETIVARHAGSRHLRPGQGHCGVWTDFFLRKANRERPRAWTIRGSRSGSLRANFMPPWIGAITKAGAGVMPVYRVEDVPAHASVKWMNDVLRQEIGFKDRRERGGGFGTLLYGTRSHQKETGLLGLRAESI